MTVIGDRAARRFGIEHAGAGAIRDAALAITREALAAKEALDAGAAHPGRRAAADGPQNAAVGHVRFPHPSDAARHGKRRAEASLTPAIAISFLIAGRRASPGCVGENCFV